MPEAPTSNMGLILPTEGSDSGTWDTLLNTALRDEVDPHDHTTGKGVQVPSAGLNINADLSFAGNSLTNLEAAVFGAVASFASNTSLWVRSSDNELIWRNNAGTDVQLTSGSGINASLAGGFTGDYTTTDAEANYVDASKTYRMLQDLSPLNYADLEAASISIREQGTGISNDITLASPASLAAAFTLTLPTALPASTSVMTVDSSGNMALTRALAVDSLSAATGNITATTGDIVATAGNVTAASGYVQTSEANIRHGEIIRQVPIPFVDGTSVLGSLNGTVGNATNGGAYYAAGSAEVLALVLPVAVGERIKQVRAIVFDNDGTGNGIQMGLWKQDAGTLGITTPPGTLTQVGSAPSTANSAAFQALTIGSLTETISDAQDMYRVHFTITASASVRLYACYVTVDRVA